MGYFRSIYSTDLPHRAVTVYMYLHDHADVKGQCWPAIGTIARELGLSRSTVKRAISDLTRSGFITTEQRWRQNGARSSLLFLIRDQPTRGP
ncbi:helix-turn-helix domain-containing protein [Anaerotruncus rubiinfantis]|uniref:helix-turn-helix domain-containing protein n=1 Tax=Anaerotruncus rubiinfantis TaxID=1720200 RepID=UPI0009AE5AB5|nr:helix-turn-helix domain-containing protein [Anaerotruncus rubiinfantis]